MAGQSGDESLAGAEDSEAFRYQDALIVNKWEFCDLCNRRENISWKCIHCLQILCELCCQTHMNGRITMHHFVYHKSDEEKEEYLMQIYKCATHKKENVMYYCKEDDALICNDCFMGNHRKHTIRKIEKEADVFRSDLKDVLGLVTDTSDNPECIQMIQKTNIMINNLDNQLKTANSLNWQTNALQAELRESNMKTEIESLKAAQKFRDAELIYQRNALRIKIKAVEKKTKSQERLAKKLERIQNELSDFQRQLTERDWSKDEDENEDDDEKEDDRETIQYLLEQPYDTDDVDIDNLHHRAEEEYRRLKTSQMYLSSQFKHADYSSCTKCTAKTEDDVPSFVLESTGHGLLRFLRTISQDKGVFTKRHPEEAMWNEFARLQIAEQHLILARNAVGPDLNKVVIVERKDFYAMQDELQQKNEEVEELSTRLGRFASNQLTEGNPNIADLSDTHRPTKVGEMFGQLYDDEWSEAFEALKPEAEGEDEEEIYPDVLIKLQKIVMAAFEFCSRETKKQMQIFQKDLLKTAMFSSLLKLDGMEQQIKSRLTMHSVIVMKKMASMSAAQASEEFVKTQLPKLVEREKLSDDRVVAYANKCVELCWYMRVHDPPMVLVTLTDGDKMNTDEYAYHARKGRVVEVCLWPALFLHKGGPLVAKGHALPREKYK